MLINRFKQYFSFINILDNLLLPASMHSVRVRLLSEKTNAIVFWQSEGARYVRAMCLFLISDVPNKHVDIPNIHISMLGN